MFKQILIAGLACLGLQSQQARLAAHPQESAERSSLAKNGSTAREIKEDHFGGFLNGIRGQYMRSGGHTPYQWGVSKECAQMRRKNKLRSIGISGNKR